MRWPGRPARQLAALGWAARASGAQGPVPPVPDLGSHALADQLQVLTGDALTAGADPAAVRDVLTRLASELRSGSTDRGGRASAGHPLLVCCGAGDSSYGTCRPIAVRTAGARTATARA